MEEMIDRLSANVPQSENEYIDEDGLLRCAKCHRRTQTQVEFMGIVKKVRCICDCKKRELEEYAERERQQEMAREKRKCFAESNMAKWTFENDDRRNAKLSDAMIKYAENFAEFKKESQGLLLYGTVGTGKTYFAAAIANRLVEKGTRVLMTNFSRLTNQIQETFDEKQKFIDSLNMYSLLIIDDLGAERKSEFMQEMVFNIIDARYRSGLPFIITTNLTAAELKKPQEVGYSRIYDRILERCFPVEVSGNSRRRENLKESFFEVKEKLGL